MWLFPIVAALAAMKVRRNRARHQFGGPVVIDTETTGTGTAQGYGHVVNFRQDIAETRLALVHAGKIVLPFGFDDGILKPYLRWTMQPTGDNAIREEEKVEI